MKDVTNRIIYIGAAVIFLGLVAGAFYIGLSKEENASENDIIMSRALVYAESAADLTEEENQLPIDEYKEELPENRITANTKIIYEYFYEDNGEIVEYEEAPKYFHLDKTEQLFKELYADWEIISFSKERVVLRKVVEAPKSRSYTVGVYEGNVAVFYADDEDGKGALKEVTETPVASLPQAEQSKLLNGIPIGNENDLIKILEDYSS